VTDAALARPKRKWPQFWALREGIPEAEKAHGKAAKHDVSVPVSRMAAFMEEAIRQGRSACWTTPWSSPLAMWATAMSTSTSRARRPARAMTSSPRCAPVTEAIYDLVDKHGGSISAEHGVGVLKRAELAKRKPVEVAVMRAIKQALDPNAIMNPRVMLDIG
jgi:FAD/FMN-containing dehydrogenase